MTTIAASRAAAAAMADKLNAIEGVHVQKMVFGHS